MAVAGWAAGLFAVAGRDEKWAGIKAAGPHTGKGKQRMFWADSRASWVSAHYRVGVRKILFFSNLFIICKLILNSI
jgi:hypothetical protein